MLSPRGVGVQSVKAYVACYTYSYSTLFNSIWSPLDTDKVCSVKRKSTGGDAVDGTPAEGATPEKKAKLDEPAEEDAKTEAEVAA